MHPRVLVVTSCTGEKRFKPDNQLTIEDFKDTTRLKRRETELTSYMLPAGEMYTGGQHIDLMAGIKDYRLTGGVIDLAIVSAGYGLIRETDPIVPYEVTFNNMNGTKAKAWAEYLQIPQQLRHLTREYDLVFFLLGDKYLRAIDLPLEVHHEQEFIFFAGSSTRQSVLSETNHHMLMITEREASLFHSGLIRIKGFLFSELLRQIKHAPETYWSKIYSDTSKVRDLIMDSLSPTIQANLFDKISYDDVLPFYSELMPVSPDQIAANYGTELLYFMPENDDRVDPGYDFLTDRPTPDRDPLTNDWYAHQFYGEPQYNGMLISKVNVDKAAKRKKLLIEQLGIRDFLRLPNNFPIMGDCGAFSYKDQTEPPYSTDEVLNYYQDLGFNLGVSIDHLIVGPYQKDEVERNRRFRLTLDNANEFLRKHRAGHYTFTPVGIAQGWSPESFAEAVQELIHQGYKQVALGGLALEPSMRIYEILKAVAPIIPSTEFRLHLFGVAREMHVMKAFHQLGVTSFDSASPLRRAWLGSGHNYHTLDGTHYAAIRVPEASPSQGRVKKAIQEGLGEFSTFKHLERKALLSVRNYSQGLLDITTTLRAILDYDELLGDNREQHEEMYRQVLREKPWEKCSCEICKEIGLEVMLFRGNNRNRRRGFHNTFVYFKQVQELQREIFGVIAH